MGNGLARELREVKPAEPDVLPDRDVRAGTVPLLRGVLRFETVRRLIRVIGLAWLLTKYVEEPAYRTLAGLRVRGLGARAFAWLTT